MAKKQLEQKDCCGTCFYCQMEKADKLVCSVLPPYLDADFDAFRAFYEPKSHNEAACRDFKPRMQ